MKNKELLNVLIKKLEKSIGNYDYYSEEGQILDKIKQKEEELKGEQNEKEIKTETVV